jgi:AcrR family transcriptional regulator
MTPVGTIGFMPVKKGDSLDPVATRRRVLRTAARLFYDRGTHPVGVNEIADAAGVSKLTLYRHFGSKEGLIRAFLQEHSDATIEGMEEIAARDELTADERILIMFDQLGSLFQRRRYRGCALMNTAAEWRGSDSEAGALARAHVDRIRQVMLGLCDEGGFAQPAALADQLVLLFEGAISLRMTRSAEDPAADARAAAAALIAAHRQLTPA